MVRCSPVELQAIEPRGWQGSPAANVIMEVVTESWCCLILGRFYIFDGVFIYIFQGFFSKTANPRSAAEHFALWQMRQWKVNASTS